MRNACSQSSAREVGDLAGMRRRRPPARHSRAARSARRARATSACGDRRIGGVTAKELDLAEAGERGEVGLDLLVAAAAVHQHADAALEERRRRSPHRCRACPR